MERVGEQVPERPPQPSRIAVDAALRRAENDCQAHVLRVELRPKAFDHVAQQGMKVEGSPHDDQIAARHAGHGQEVVDEPRLPLDIALDDVAQAVEVPRQVRLGRHGLDGGEDRREGRAQLVADQGQELVLRARCRLRGLLGFGEGPLGFHALGDVDGDAADAQRLAVHTTDCLRVELEPDGATVLGSPARSEVAPLGLAQDSPHPAQEAALVVGQHEAHPAVRLVEPLVDRIAEQGDGVVADEVDAVRVAHARKEPRLPHDAGGRRDDVGQTLALRTRLLVESRVVDGDRRPARQVLGECHVLGAEPPLGLARSEGQGAEHLAPGDQGDHGRRCDVGVAERGEVGHVARVAGEVLVADFRLVDDAAAPQDSADADVSSVLPYMP